MKPSRDRKLFLLLCWVTYLSAYLCRVNMSTVLYKLGPALGVGTEGLGLLGSLFFITYAIGQLVNGYLGDRVRPSAYLTTAVFATAVLNLIISFSNNYAVMLACWALNGFAQSMFWGPLMRMLSHRFDRSSNVNLAIVMSSSFNTGYILSWTVLGRLLVDSGWQAHFLVPAVLALPVLLAWATLSLRDRMGKNIPQASTPGPKGLLRIFRAERLWLAVVVCACLGLVKESITLWTPLLLINTLHIDVKSSFLVVLAIPVANYGGVFLSAALARRLPHRIGLALTALFAVVGACSLAIALAGTSSILSVVLIATISAMLSGANSLLLSVIPLSFASHGIVSSLVGIFDFSSYVGAAISSFLLSMILSGGSLGPVALVWLAAALLATACSRKLKTGGKEGAKLGSDTPQCACPD